MVLRRLRGESLAALSREVGVEIYRLEDWRDRAVAGLERGLQVRQGDLVAEALDAAKRHIAAAAALADPLLETRRAADLKAEGCRDREALRNRWLRTVEV